MKLRRPLAELLEEIASSALEGTAGAPIAVHGLEIDLPIELRLHSSDEGAALHGDVPLFLTRTPFDPPVSRLAVRWEAGEVEP
ncbi:hypothetical protein ACI5KX_04955 [Erythrobacter sp. GH1-10]|uniref:hypothetical protein n=1 Tax=Erythrobacter sp. GH1-10 TaxID=3349334 RepID=UPI003877F331